MTATTTTTTTTMPRVRCELSGFPPQPPPLTAQDIQRFLPIWAIRVAVIQEIRNAPPHPTATGSVILNLPSIEVYNSLVLFCRTIPYRGTHIIQPRLLEAPNQSHAPTAVPTAASTATPTTTDTATTNETTTSRNARRRRGNRSNQSVSFQQAARLADQFLTFLHESDHPLISTRDTIGRTFQSFLQINRGNNNNDVPNNRRLEPMVMARMRQMKWLKATKRSAGGMGLSPIVVSIVQPDRQTFPTLADRNTARQIFIEQQNLAEQDKEGVSLTLWHQGQAIPKASTVRATLGQVTILELEMTTSSQEQERTVLVEEIDVRGAQAHALEPTKADTLSLLASLPTHLSHFRLAYKIQPRSSIGIMRMTIHVALEAESTFSISRSITISFGNPELDAVLQPTAPYQKRPRATIQERHEQVHWPETTTTPRSRNNPRRNRGARGDQPESMGTSGMATLPKYTIPKDTMTLIRNNEMESVLNALRWSPKTTEATKQPPPSSDTNTNNTEASNAASSSALLPSNPEMYKCRTSDYGKFWSTLLHVSEYQSLQDIQLFDMKQVALQRRPRSLFALEVPGLAEGRPSVLRGDYVNLSWKNHLYKGRVHTTEQLQVILEVPIKFANSFNPSVDRVDMVRFTFSRTTLRTSHRACLELARKNLGQAILEPTQAIVQQYRNARLVEQPAREAAATTTRSSAPTTPATLSFANRNLNPEQQRAVYQIVHDKGGQTLPYILFGPPGTGKTTVVVETVYQLAIRHLRTGQAKPNILLAAPSNDAADILVGRLATFFPPKELLRVLAYSRNRNDLPMDILPYVNQHEEDDQEKLQEILKANIVVSTVNLAARFVYMGVPKGHFSIICVDEAGHATEPELVAVAASLYDTQSPHSQLILAGDPKQLGPITTSKICESYGLGISLMERLSQRFVYQRNEETNQYPNDLLTKLVRNYRSHPALLRLPNEMFYDGELVCSADMMVTHTMARWEYLPTPGFPILFHSIQGENLREANSPSWFNPQEAQQVVAYVNLLLRETKPPLREEEIGIITPYARQAQKIRAALQVSHPNHDIKVGSVECFQGQERRVILLSTVRSEPELYLDHDIRYNLGFIAHPKRFNVAMTRAKALLIVIGCPSVLALDKENWLPFLQYCHENGAIIGEPWDPSSARDEDEEENYAVDNHQEAEAGDEIVGNDQLHELTNMMQSWDLVQAEETFAYVNREE